MKKLLLFIVSFAFFVIASTSILDYVLRDSITSTTVAIVNLRGNSGGSGTILYSSSLLNSSEILTNGHVCEVVRNGGNVITDDGKKHFVVAFQKSRIHDLCLVIVLENLHVSARIASRPPVTYSKSIVSGHPHLLPTIVTEGHFSGKLEVTVLVGSKDCTDAERLNPDTMMFCAIFGKLPIIKKFDSIVTSSLIQPGSSGSAVYNSSNEISAVIFAGAGDLGYGLAVPYEYIREFLDRESADLPLEAPNTESQFPGNSQERSPSIDDYYDFCKNNSLNNEICTLVEETFKFHNELVE